MYDPRKILKNSIITNMLSPEIRKPTYTYTYIQISYNSKNCDKNCQSARKKHSVFKLVDVYCSSPSQHKDINTCTCKVILDSVAPCALGVGKAATANSLGETPGKTQ